MTFDNHGHASIPIARPFIFRNGRKPHFDRTAFKVIKRRTFATLHEASSSANIVLTPAEQKEFRKIKETGIYPVPNQWGEKGWTIFELENVSEGVVQATLDLAYQAVLKKN